MTDLLPVSGQSPSQSNTSDQAARARQAALKLEASFLSEMLKAAGFGTQISQFSGGSGEDQFASFHREAIAERIASAGGIGLAEHFFRAMMETQNDT